MSASNASVRSIPGGERGRRALLALSTALVAVAACTERSPSGPDDGQLPTEPVTVTLQLDWPDFASNLEVYGGYAGPAEMSNAVVARSYGGMEARTLLSFGSFPASALVRADPASPALTADTALTWVDAYVVVLFDTIASTNNGPVTVAMGETLEKWHEQSATWANAVDTAGGVQPWSQPGGGAVLPIGTWDWDPTTTDSATFYLDQTEIARWDGAPDSIRSVRIDLLTDGHRLQIGGAALRLVATSVAAPDTTLVLTVSTTSVTFVYDPPATAPADGIRVGGAPAWRSVLDVALPATLSGPPELCAAVGCPFALQPENVTYAALGLRGRRPPDAFTPTDSLTFDVRAVLSRAALPKSPLGNSLVQAGGTPVPADIFGVLEGTMVDIPITAFVQGFLAGPDPSGRPPSNTLAILSGPEPASFTFAEFFGPGGPNAPVLKLILTASPPLELR
jgi:hypothetical protein